MTDRTSIGLKRDTLQKLKRKKLKIEDKESESKSFDDVVTHLLKQEK